jgi:hypothetical protein
METGMEYGDAKERPRGPQMEEIRNEMVSSAQKLLPAYEKNVAPLLAEKGLHHGVPDPHGHIDDAKQIIRVLKTVQDPRIDPHHWPKEFQIPDHIRFVLINEEGTPFSQEVPRRDFDNPKKFVEALEGFLIVGQIEGL